MNEAVGSQQNPIIIASDPVEEALSEVAYPLLLMQNQPQPATEAVDEPENNHEDDGQPVEQHSPGNDGADFLPSAPDSPIPSISAQPAGHLEAPYVALDSSATAKTPGKEIPPTSQVSSFSMSSTIDDESEDELSFLTPTVTRLPSHKKPSSRQVVIPRCGANGIACGRSFCIKCSANDSDVDF